MNKSIEKRHNIQRKAAVIVGVPRMLCLIVNGDSNSVICHVMSVGWAPPKFFFLHKHLTAMTSNRQYKIKIAGAEYKINGKTAKAWGNYVKGKYILVNNGTSF